MTYEMQREVQEAINAGEGALTSLRDAQSYLNSAGNWGIVDILGGGFITDLIKHSKLRNASQCMDRARNDLRTFQKELDDVDNYLPNIEVGDFMTFADFFFDGFVADLFMQSKIGEAKKQVSEAIYQVESIVNRLRYEVSGR